MVIKPLQVRLLLVYNRVSRSRAYFAVIFGRRQADRHESERDRWLTWLILLSWFLVMDTCMSRSYSIYTAIWAYQISINFPSAIRKHNTAYFLL